MKMYHRTTAASAKRILSEGFKDGTDRYMTDREFSGVWLSVEPLDSNEGAQGDTLLCVDLDCTERDLSDFEWIEDGKTKREWLIPADLVNRRSRVSTVRGEREK